ncbi:MAG: TIGR00341 family protein [Methanomassiliicoccales archaeon]
MKHMEQRLLEIVIPTGRAHRVRDIAEENGYLDMWEEECVDDRTLFRILTKGEQTELLLDDLESHLSWIDGFRVVILPVEASLPRPEEEEEKEEKEGEEEVDEEGREKKKAAARISREELYSDVSAMTKVSTSFIMLVILSALVATVGLYSDSVAVIIGAMVIAPFLGPNVAFSMATTLGDKRLAGWAGKANLTAIGLALALSIVIGYFLNVDPTNFEIMSRTTVGVGDIVLALSAGTAGAISITVGVGTALVGVMVAVALLPGLVAFGLLLGAGYVDLAMGAMLLFLINLICVNLSGVVVFLASGVRPRIWWEAEQAKRSTWIAIGMWTVMLMVLVIAAYFSQAW